MNHWKLIFLIITLHHYKNIEKHGMRNKNLPLIYNFVYFVKIGCRNENIE